MTNESTGAKIGRWLIRVLGAGIAIFFYFDARFMLKADTISDTTFVAYVTSGFFFGLIVILLPRVAELSLGKLKLKLRELSAAAEERLNMLDKATRSILGLQLKLVARLPGGYSSVTKNDERIDDFWEVKEMVDNAGLSSQLNTQILAACLQIARGQLSVLDNLNGTSLLREEDLPEPSAIRSHALENDHVLIQNAVRVQLSPDEFTRILAGAIDEYAKLFRLVTSLSSDSV